MNVLHSVRCWGTKHDIARRETQDVFHDWKPTVSLEEYYFVGVSWYTVEDSMNCRM